VYPGGCASPERGYISVIVWCKTDHVRKVHVNVTLRHPANVARMHNKVLSGKASVKDTQWHTPDGSQGVLFGEKNFITRGELDEFLKDDKFVFDITVAAWSCDVERESTQGSNASGPCQLGKLLSELKSTDVTLLAAPEGADVCSLHAHRHVLAARSDVFERMFFGEGMKEASLGSEVSISDISEGIARVFLHALYTDEIKAEVWEDAELICHLFAAFHKYHVKGGLLERCELRVVAQFSVDNVAERLMMADLLDIMPLRNAALGFIAQHVAKVQATDGFQRLTKQRPRMLAEILARAAPPAKRAQPSSSEDLPANFDALRIVDLKKLLSDRGLTSSGSKADLVARLRASGK